MENEVQQVSDKQRNRSRMALVGLFLMFLVPIVGAITYVSIYSDVSWTGVTTNRGELIRPSKPLNDFSFATLEGETISLEDLKGFWTMVTIESAKCDKQCQENLYKIRQSRLGTGGEKERVQRLMILTDGQPSESLATLLKEHPGMHVSVLAGKQLADFIKPFNHDGKAVGGQRIYFVDPLGNLMMQYAPEATAKDVVKDLERLLKYSHTG